MIIENKYMKNWSTIAVGDSIFKALGDEAKVLEVGASGKTFLVSEWRKVITGNWMTTTSGWYHIEEAICNGWTLGEKEKDKVEEFDEWLADLYKSHPYLPYDEILAKIKELFDSNSA
jgi:hypothetical protein